MEARNRVGIGLSYRPVRLPRLAESIPWIRFLGSLNVLKFGLGGLGGLCEYMYNVDLGKWNMSNIQRGIKLKYYDPWIRRNFHGWPTLIKYIYAFLHVQLFCSCSIEVLVNHEAIIRGGGKTVSVVFKCLFRARICKRLRSSGIDSASLCSLGCRTRPATLGIDSWAL